MVQNLCRILQTLEEDERNLITEKRSQAETVVQNLCRILQTLEEDVEKFRDPFCRDTP